jgi:Zn-dependent protease
MEALQQALWAADEQQAWSAAVYLMDGGDSTTPGLARALAFAGFGDHGYDDDAAIRLRMLLENPVSRPSALDALRSALLRGRPGHNHNVAALLVLAGEPLHRQILSEFDSEHVARRWPLGLLSALALSGRVQEAREAAGALGLSRLAHLLAEDEEPALT